MADRRRGRRLGRGRWWVAGLILAPLPGCNFVPRSRLDDAAKLVQGLRAENSQLKDTNLGLKSRNEDLNQRAVDDAQSIQALETANARYQRSIAAYQDDREAMRAAFGEIKDQLRAAPQR